MRKPLFLTVPLLASLLLAGCVNDSASYRVDSNDHAIVLRVVQDYFWKKQAALRLIAVRMPDCQRQFDLGEIALSGLEIELFESGPNVFTLRAGEETWQVETQGCTRLEAPDAKAVSGRALGVFHMDEHDKLVFEAAGTAP